MKVLGFNFTKLSGNKTLQFSRPYALSTNIEFTDITEDSLDVLKESLLKVGFHFSVDYTKPSKDKKVQPAKDKKDLTASVEIDGFAVVSVKADEAKEILKSWKKKQMTNTVQIPLFNIILKKCTPKAIEIESDLDLPLHVPVPQIRAQPNTTQK